MDISALKKARESVAATPRSGKVRRRLILGSAVAAVAMLAAGCGSGGSGSSGSAASDTKGPVSVSMFGGEPNTVINVNTNWFTKYAEKKFGLSFKFSTTPTQDVTQKEPLLLGSGDYPDVIWSGQFTQTDAEKYGSQGIFVPLNALIKKYAPNVQHLIDTQPAYRQAVTAPNGKIYALTSFNYCYHCFWTYQSWINIKDLNEFNLSMPRTTTQFEHVLEVFKQHGLVPLTGDSDAQGGYGGDLIVFLMNAFIPFNSDLSQTTTPYFDVQKGHAVFVPVQPQWRAGLSYIYGLYKKGLWSKVALTQQPQALDNLVTNEKVGVFPSGGPNTAIANYGQKSSHYLDWLALPALKGPSGVSSAAFSGDVNNSLVFAITNKAPQAAQIRIMKLLNYMYTATGAQTEDFGPAGRFWSKAKKGQDGLVPQQALFNTDWNAFYSGNSEQNAGWNQWGPIDQNEEWRNLSYATPPFSASGAQTLLQLASAVGYAGHQAPEVYPTAVWVPPADSQSYATEQTNIDSYVNQWTAEFETGTKSLSADWGTYLAGLKRLGLTQYEATSQKIMRAPISTTASDYQTSPSDIKYLVCAGPVPALTKRYLIESGVPSSDFSCKK